MGEEEIVEILKEIKNNLLEDVNRVEEWVNTGNDEEKIQAIERNFRFI